MDRPAHQRWLRSAMFFAIVYPVVGITFAALGNPSASNEMRITWRLAAWVVCAAAFAAHLAYEHFRLRSSPLRAAWHVSAAVSLGAFALAVWVNVHAHWGASRHQSPLAPLALVVFPAVTGIPAFVVALVVVAVLARMCRRSSQRERLDPGKRRLVFVRALKNRQGSAGACRALQPRPDRTCSLRRQAEPSCPT